MKFSGNDLLITVKGTIGELAILKLEKAHIARQIMAIHPLAIDQIIICNFSPRWSVAKTSASSHNRSLKNNNDYKNYRRFCKERRFLRRSTTSYSHLFLTSALRTDNRHN